MNGDSDQTCSERMSRTPVAEIGEWRVNLIKDGVCEPFLLLERRKERVFPVWARQPAGKRDWSSVQYLGELFSIDVNYTVDMMGRMLVLFRQPHWRSDCSEESLGEILATYRQICLGGAYGVEANVAAMTHLVSFILGCAATRGSWNQIPFAVEALRAFMDVSDEESDLRRIAFQDVEGCWNNIIRQVAWNRQDECLTACLSSLRDEEFDGFETETLAACCNYCPEVLKGHLEKFPSQAFLGQDLDDYPLLSSLCRRPYHPDIIRYMIDTWGRECVRDMTEFCDPYDGNNSVLHSLVNLTTKDDECMHRAIEVASILLDLNPSLANKRASTGHTALHIAIMVYCRNSLVDWHKAALSKEFCIALAELYPPELRSAHDSDGQSALQYLARDAPPDLVSALTLPVKNAALS